MKRRQPMTTLAPFSSDDRRRKIASIEIPDHWPPIDSAIAVGGRAWPKLQ